MPKRKVIHPEWPWNDRIGIAHAVRVGDTVYVSGQVALDPEGMVVGKGDLYLQSKQVFANIGYLLDEAGARLSDIVKLTAFLVDFDQFDGYATARRETFGNPPYSFAATGVGVTRLIHPDLLIEVEAVAVVGS